MSDLQKKGLFGAVLAVDFIDGARKYFELDPSKLKQKKNDIRDGKVKGAIRFNVLTPQRSKVPEWRARGDIAEAAADTIKPKSAKAKTEAAPASPLQP